MLLPLSVSFVAAESRDSALLRIFASASPQASSENTNFWFCSNATLSTSLATSALPFLGGSPFAHAALYGAKASAPAPSSVARRPTARDLGGAEVFDEGSTLAVAMAR